MSSMINLAALVLLNLAGLPQQGDALQAVAEQSGFKATARHGDVVALCKELARDIELCSTASSGSRPREGRCRC